GRIVVVTGAASGIGRALVQRFGAEGAKAVVAVDRDGDGARATAQASGSTAMVADVSVQAEIESVVERTERELGPIDLFCSNAGIFVEGGVEVPEAAWDRIWRINVLA